MYPKCSLSVGISVYIVYRKKNTCLLVALQYGLQNRDEDINLNVYNDFLFDEMVLKHGNIKDENKYCSI